MARLQLLKQMTADKKLQPLTAASETGENLAIFTGFRSPKNIDF